MASVVFGNSCPHSPGAARLPLPEPGDGCGRGWHGHSPSGTPRRQHPLLLPRAGPARHGAPPVCGVPPAGLTATGRAPNAHPALPGRAAAARPGGPKGGGAPVGAPDGADSGGAAIPTAGPHRLASPPASAGPAPARPAPSPLSPNASLNFQPRPLPMQQERGQTRSLPAALDPPPRLPAMAARLGLREPQMRGHRRPSRSQAPRRPRRGGRAPAPPSSAACAGSAAAAHSPAELALSRAAPGPALSQPAGGAPRPARRRSASSGRGAGQQPQPVCFPNKGLEEAARAGAAASPLLPPLPSSPFPV